MYVKLKNGIPEKYPYSYSKLREDNPGTSFPMPMSDEGLASWEVFPVESTEKPVVDYTKTVTEEMPVYVDGKWKQSFSVVDATEEEIIQRKIELNMAAENNRSVAYRYESDPLFFKWQRGESTQQEWLDKVAEIKNRYPMV